MKKIIGIAAITITTAILAISGVNLYGKTAEYKEKIAELESLESEFRSEQELIQQNRASMLAVNKEFIVNPNDKFDVASAITACNNITIEEINVYKMSDTQLAKVATLSFIGDVANLTDESPQTLEFVIRTTDENSFLEHLSNISVEYTNISVAKLADKVVCRVAFDGGV